MDVLHSGLTLHPLTETILKFAAVDAEAPSLGLVSQDGLEHIATDLQKCTCAGTEVAKQQVDRALQRYHEPKGKPPVAGSVKKDNPQGINQYTVGGSSVKQYEAGGGNRATTEAHAESGKAMSSEALHHTLGLARTGDRVSVEHTTGSRLTGTITADYTHATGSQLKTTAGASHTLTSSRPGVASVTIVHH